MSQYANLNQKLKNIFQIDRPDLDFGIYRILNARRREISDYLDNRLKTKVETYLADAKSDVHDSQLESITNQIKEEFGKRAFDDAGNLVSDAAMDSPLGEQYEQLREHSDSSFDQAQVFSHLYTFFSRYYDEGDFISQRRYKGDTYAIPYSGEEVMLHWANKDQYYTKSGEMFSNYRIRFNSIGEPDKSVLFRLLSADTAKDNQKDNDKNRRFVMLSQPKTITHTDEEGEEYEEIVHPIELNEAGDELTVWFEYAVMNGKTKQDKLNEQAHDDILDNPKVSAAWATLLKHPAPTEKQSDRDLLRKHLDAYTQKNTADYFIHKDLGKFLNNELDFYIKNEVMHLDDVVNSSGFIEIERQLALIKCLRKIGQELIDFLASLENFQKKLWLKKKFVVSSHYCITLDRVDEDLYDDIANNPEQWQQWESLGFKVADDSLPYWGSSQYLEEHPYLMVDTSLFELDFKAKLLNSIDDLDEQTDGLIINGDNFQALDLMQEKYQEKIDCIYIDPPYNTGSDTENNTFLYKDSYKHSSWATMLESRLILSRELINDFGGIWVSTDDGEYARLNLILEGMFGADNFIADVIWKSRSSVSSDTIISGSINHTTFYSKNKSYLNTYKSKFRLPESLDGFINPDNDSRGPWKLDPMDAPNVRANLSYAITNPETKEVFYPPEGRCWRFEEKDVIELLEDNRIIFGKTGNSRPAFKRFYSEAKDKGRTTTTLWDDVKTTSHATKGLYDLFNNISKETLNKIKPKPVELVKRILELYSKVQKNTVNLDYFAGSGTTAHAAINLNREDGGNRKYILVEQGEYFDTVLKPRIQKVVYSEGWKGGKPLLPKSKSGGSTENPYKGISHCLKVVKLESYEDTLNNLELNRNSAQSDLFGDLTPAQQDDYLMHYMLDIESKNSLLNVADFHNPFDYQLKITADSAGAYTVQNIDLIDTFNYLIGLKVRNIDYQLKQGYVQVVGHLRTGEFVTVFWRDVEKVNYEALDKIMNKLSINPKDEEYKYIYVNGDHNINSKLIKKADGSSEIKVRSIEQVFLERMFAE